MWKWMANLVWYAASLAFGLLLIPYFAWTHSVVNQGNLAVATALAPLVFWSVYLAHGILYDHGAAAVRYLFESFTLRANRFVPEQPRRLNPVTVSRR